MRRLIWYVIAAVALAGIVWWAAVMRGTDGLAPEGTQPAVQPGGTVTTGAADPAQASSGAGSGAVPVAGEAVPAVSAADAAADAAATAADAAAEASANADAARVGPAADAAAQAEAAAEQAIEAADEAARAADAATDSAASGNDAVARNATEAATVAAEQAAEASQTAAQATTTAAEIATLLTPEGFDRARVDQLIDNSSIADAQKTTLKAVIASAEGNPAILQAALDQVRAVLR